MKNKLLRLVAVLTLCGIALSLTAWAIAQKGEPATQRGGTKRQTLRDIARERDVEIDVAEGENGTEYSDLRLLTKHAEAIVVGRVVSEESSFDGDDHIITTSQLDIQRVIKHTKLNGPLGPGDEPPAPLGASLNLVRPGGSVLVNGHRASRKSKGAEMLQPKP